MAFDAAAFLKAYADAYNARNPEAMRALLATDDPRFSVFEDFAGELLDGRSYSAMLESVADARGEMSFDLAKCDDFGDYAVVHAFQHMKARPGEEAEEGYGTLTLRATMWVSTSGAPRIVSGHFSEVPPEDDGCGCGCGDDDGDDCCGGGH